MPAFVDAVLMGMPLYVGAVLVGIPLAGVDEDAEGEAEFELWPPVGIPVWLALEPTVGPLVGPFVAQTGGGE